MSEPFDPYLQWLGIRDPQRPPNHYRLLGVELFETDADVLANAADRQMAHVRTFQTGKHGAESQRLLNELAAAKVCLLDPQRKAEYDAVLWSQLQAASQAYSAAPPSDAETGQAPPSPEVVPAPALPVRSTRRSRYLWTVTGLLAAIVVLVMLIVLTSGRGGPNEAPGRAVFGRDSGVVTERDAGSATEGEPDAATKQGPGTEASQARPPKPAESDEPAVRPAPETQPTPKTRPQAEPQPEPEPEFEPPASVAEAIRAAREAMTARAPETARRYLDFAEQSALPRDRREIEQLQVALMPLSAFWKGVRRGVDELAPGETLAVADRQVTVTGVAPGAITVRDGEQESRYTLGTLPAELALAVADRGLPDLPTATVSRAAFLIFDPQGDRDLARQLCQQAEAEGLPVETLVAELDRLTAPPEAPAKAGETAPPAVPDEAAISEARRKVLEVFGGQMAKAHKPEEKQALARLLLNQAVDTTDNPAARYVLFVEARDLAVQAGSASLVSEAVREMAKHYQLDEREEIARTLSDAVDKALPPAARRDLAEEAIDQADKAIGDDDYPSAAVLARVANTLALKGLDAPTAKRAKDLIDEIPRLQQQYERSLDASKTLAEEPGNPQANLALGKYYCFFKREPQWKKGLPLLARGDDPVLQALAEAEAGVTAASQAADKVQLADQWYEASASVPDEIRTHIQARAVFWYQEALDELSGFTKTRVEKRLEEIEAAKPKRQGP